ncbi:replication restart helicase PriA [Xylanibacter muris]|uniref:Replication restart protein PriA n=1 Tax=Xylanibacter muris TaxID=2736290 RepID=A0ABX2AR42_9BACT|nr:primosomal protein N' [Xylanibacter muris]NPD92512.1 primosomal protein N' [Xylanibacter muris]
MIYADIILPLPLDGLFTYSVPDEMSGEVKEGMRVLVPLGKSRHYVGIISGLHSVRPEGYEVKEISGLLDSAPAVLPRQLELWRWISNYYMAPLGDVYKAAMPSALKTEERLRPKTEQYVRLSQVYRSEGALHVAMNILERARRQKEVFVCYLSMSHWDEAVAGDGSVMPREITREELMNASHANVAVVRMLVDRGILETYEKEVGRLNDGGEPDFRNIKEMSRPQTEAYNRILLSFFGKNVTLLHGVTSSGKTEIYIHLIRREIEDNHRQVLYLLPEIALTVQIMDRLKRVFGNRLGIYHSKYSDAERAEIWNRQLSSSPYDVILGARSAVFLPFQRLGLVIVDEEHETSYKQQDPAPRYHARSVAVVLAAMYGARTLLGTATPSVETYQNAMTGKYGLVELTQRYSGVELPEVRVVDVQDLHHRKMMTGSFSPLLLGEMRAALDDGGQVILFQNRRGFAPMVECRQCGWVPRCQHCDVSLTLHRNMNQLTCHYCGYTYRVPVECPACGGKELMAKGYGTEKIEDHIMELFPDARVGRMDLDTTRTHNAYERIISDFSSGRTNILIGTQMVSKGLDFGKVSVVGILNADSMLNFPDFRAYEHAFQMMSQVSGRSGRRGRRGLVILQTKSPGLPVIDHVVRNDYGALFREVTDERRMFNYPPFCRLIYVYLRHKSDKTAEAAALEMGRRLRYLLPGRVLGPDKPPVARVKEMNIRKLVIKLENGIDMNRVRECLHDVRHTIMADKRNSLLQVYYDVDPV